jgi:hypothetical protein
LLAYAAHAAGSRQENDKMYLDINKTTLKKYEELGKKTAKDICGDDCEQELIFDEVDIIHQDINFEEGKLIIYTDGVIAKDDLCTISLEVPITTEIAIDVIEYYTKQLNKMKTVLEGIKE